LFKIFLSHSADWCPTEGPGSTRLTLHLHLLGFVSEHVFCVRSNDASKFREDLMNIARTTLSSKILTQYKDHFANLAVTAVLRLKASLIHCRSLCLVFPLSISDVLTSGAFVFVLRYFMVPYKLSVLLLLLLW